MNSPSNELKQAHVIAAAVLFVTLIFSLLVSFNIVSSRTDIQTQEFEALALNLEKEIESRMLAYEQVLHATKGLFLSMGNVTREEFATFFDTLNIDEHYPGMLGLGLSLRLSPDMLSEHIEDVVSEGFPQYTVSPEGERDQYSAIVYLEPFSGVNLNAFGFDMYSEEVRREAMQRSVNERRAALSGRVSLVQDVDRGGVAGTLLYLPVFNNELPGGAANRGVYGWVYSPFSMDILMQGLSFSSFHLVSASIYDGAVAENQFLLFSSNSTQIGDRASAFTYRTTISIAGQLWTLDVKSDVAFERGTSAVGAYVTFIIGVLISLLLTALVWVLVSGRERANQRAEEITQELRSTEYRWSAALESAGDGVWDWNFRQNKFLFSEQTKTMLKYADDELDGGIENWLKIVYPEDVDRTIKSMNALRLDADLKIREEFRVKTRDGGWSWILMRGAAVEKAPNGQANRAIGTFTDITDRKLVEEQHEYFALHDELTGLPNRRAVNESLEALHANAQRTGTNLALMFIDLDHFKEINDTYGHEVGDQVLCGASKRLKQTLHLTDILGRFGGDEFVAILSQANNVDDVAVVAKDIKAAMSAPLELGSATVKVTLSIGIAIYDSTSNDSITQLLKKADAALYDTKNSGRNGFTIYKELS